MATVNTRILVLSDTHGNRILPAEYGNLDLVIHCGDLTEDSALSEFKTTLDMLKPIPAPVKLIIAGNHDFTLDDDAYQQTRQDSGLSDEDLEDHGNVGDAVTLLRSFEMKHAGITYLEEGNHNIVLANGAGLKVYASPWTPYDEGPEGFQYDPSSGHAWDIHKDADIVITHGPPQGIFDITESGQRAGDPDLFSAVARAKPLLHCFGHIHPGWGARKVLWRDEIGEVPSHFTAIDNSGSRSIESAANIRQRGDNDAWQKYRSQGYCAIEKAELPRIHVRRETMFVNAAIQGPDQDSPQVPWLIELELPTWRWKIETSTS